MEKDTRVCDLHLRGGWPRWCHGAGTSLIWYRCPGPQCTGGTRPDLIRTLSPGPISLVGAARSGKGSRSCLGLAPPATEHRAFAGGAHGLFCGYFWVVTGLPKVLLVLDSCYLHGWVMDHPAAWPSHQLLGFV